MNLGRCPSHAKHGRRRDRDQERYARMAVENWGADLVIMHHPHVVQGVDIRQNRYVFYSLGNFCFGGNPNPTDKRALMFRQALIVSPDGQVSDGGIDIIPCFVSSVSNKNNYQPAIMDYENGAKLLSAMSRYSNFSDEFKWLDDCYPKRAGVLP